MALAAMATLEAAAEALNRTLDAMEKTADDTDGQWHEVHRRNSSDRPFQKRKGLLNHPVDGKVVAPFGPYTNTRFGVQGFRSGIDIQARPGEPVRAVGSGRVLYADWFKGYGNMVIIDHGDHYYTVYAHVDELFKTKGTAVTDGDVIATVGDTGSMTGPKLYFEIRHHGKPQNPDQWLKPSG